MRLPKRTELSEDQEDFLFDAPFDRPVLCIGPPGTGKTVLALYRAATLTKKKKRVELVMYNNLLSKYVLQSIKELNIQIESKTLHKWLQRLWGSANPRYNNHIPQIERYVHDFPKALKLLNTGKVKYPSKMYWEHLIIDEGQDFPKDLYLFLSFISMDEKVLAGRPTPGITVFADENQRLEEGRHSTIRDINGFLANSEIFSIRKNFRNTAPIAKLAGYFYVGLRTGIPEIPENVEGPAPVLRQFETFDQELQSIVNWLFNNDDRSCGVIVPDRTIQNSVVAVLKRIAKPKGFRVQQYSSSLLTNSIKFDKGGCITVICDKSCKGLEFDAVFLPQLQLHNTDGADKDFFKMKMYVMISRAKLYLQMSYSDCLTSPKVLDLLPPPDTELLTWQI